MRNSFVILLLLFFPVLTKAQTAHDEILSDVNLSASNYLNYPAPSKALTPAPAGYVPFYISHYGRHGSRYLTSQKGYNEPLATLRRAEQQGVLTALGCSVLDRVEQMERDSRSRAGELTALGAQQHKDIAQRMMTRFPEVFADSAHVDARSTVVIRCILSMENELQQLVRMNPQLIISHDASEHDMYYMNQQDDALYQRKENDTIRNIYRLLNDSLLAPVEKAVCSRLFSSEQYVRDSIDIDRFGYQLCSLAWILQDTELRHQFTLYDIFTPEELYQAWRVANIWWYIHYGACQLNGGKQPFSQRNLLNNIIQQADSCIALYTADNATPHPTHGATLRFGHETMVLPLTCLLGLNGADLSTSELLELESKGWINYKIFPMGANIQFVFYRDNAARGDILVKILLNENEATLPHELKPVSAPYYKWSEVRDYYITKLNSYTD